MQFPCRLMWGNGVTWAVMVTILTNPRDEDKRITHSVKKFVVPEYILELLEGQPISTGFGTKGDVLAIEDTFSLLAGRPVKLNGFVELGSLMLLAGWGLRTVNMPATHAIVCGSVLNKNSELRRPELGNEVGGACRVPQGLRPGGRETWLADLDNRPGIPVKGSVL